MTSKAAIDIAVDGFQDSLSWFFHTGRARGPVFGVTVVKEALPISKQPFVSDSVSRRR